MSRNPNMQKLGKRKNAPVRQQADWLFPSTGKLSATLKSDQLKSKHDKQLAKDLLKRRAAGKPPKSIPPPQLLEIISTFLTEYEFTATSKSLRAEIEERGEKTEIIDGTPSLSTIYNEWRELKDEDKVLQTRNGIEGIPTSSQKELKKGKVEKKKPAANDDSSSSSGGDSSSSEDSDIEMRDAPLAKKVSSRKSSSSSSSSASSSSSDSDADDENEAPAVKTAPPKPRVNGLKRKASSSSSSSASESKSDSSSEDDQPKPKKVKTTSTSAPSRNSSPSSSESGSSSSSGDEAPTPKQAKKFSSPSSSSSNSDSDSTSESGAAKLTTTVSSENRSSSSDSESDSESFTNSLAQKIPLPDSESNSSSDSSSESESEPSSDETNKKPIVSSDTSATLSDAPKKMTPSSSESSSSSDSEAESMPAQAVTAVTATAAPKLSPPLPPEPVVKPQRKTNVPFSRIPKDIKVDDRLSSNAYVPYHYADKAYEDLKVTKGKGFTKEKNKKKRGSYKGGYIDVEGKKGIKFDD